MCENGEFFDLSNIPGKPQIFQQKSHYCQCDEGFHGENCELFGGVECLNNGFSLDGKCYCTITAFSGERCEILTLPPCLPNPCDTVRE